MTPPERRDQTAQLGCFVVSDLGVDLGNGVTVDRPERLAANPSQVYPADMPTPSVPAVQSDPEIMSGTVVFAGTRVPFQTLIDYLEAGQPLSEFLEDFPTVSSEQAVAALEEAKEALLTLARPA